MGFCCFGGAEAAPPPPPPVQSPAVKKDVPPPAKIPAAPPVPFKAHQEEKILASHPSHTGTPTSQTGAPWQKEGLHSHAAPAAVTSSNEADMKSLDAAASQRTNNDVLKLNLGEVKVVLQKLASVNSTPTIALTESAELLTKHLSVNMCSITGLTDNCTSYILLAAHGLGAAELDKHTVMRGNQWSVSQLLQQPTHLYYSVHNDQEAEQLPADFQLLYRQGLSSFISVPIAADHEVLGVLTLAKEEPDAFDVDWWEPMLGCLAVGLMFYLRTEQTQNLCQLMRALDSTPDYTNLIHQLLRGAHGLLLRATNIKTGCRLALVGLDLTNALVFEPDPKPLPEGADARDAGAQIHVTEIQLENTLLLDALQKGKSRFVSDCASYIQSCMKPATDIFISGQDMVASIVVVPLMWEGETFGGFYVSMETTSNFQNIKDLLMGLVNSVAPMLAKRLQPQRQAIWEGIMARGGPVTPSQDADVRRRSEDVSVTGSTVMDSTSTVSAKPLMVKRTCTEAMLKVLQNELRKTHAKTSQLEWIEDLTLQEIAGKGGFGVVYKGIFKGSAAAVKIMYARQHERQAMKDALEMAVLTTVSHPNIIQVYNCFTDILEDASSTNQGNNEGRINIRFRRLQADEDRSLATCNILLMEYCDRQTLRHAMKQGVFHKRLGTNSVAVDLCAIVQVLIEQAQAVQHLHTLKLIHCDIKPENVLLKSEPTRALGFVTKLSDFGLAKLLRENYYIVNRSGSGTVTHLAPELFQVGSRITTAVDTFSFSIMMWEVYTGQRAYGGLGRDAIIDRVYKKKARPVFPAGAPQAYVDLAKACWDNDPMARPSFAEILTKLTDLLATLQNSAPAGGATAAAAH